MAHASSLPLPRLPYPVATAFGVAIFSWRQGQTIRCSWRKNSLACGNQGFGVNLSPRAAAKGCKLTLVGEQGRGRGNRALSSLTVLAGSSGLSAHPGLLESGEWNVCAPAACWAPGRWPSGGSKYSVSRAGRQDVGEGGDAKPRLESSDIGQTAFAGPLWRVSPVTGSKDTGLSSGHHLMTGSASHTKARRISRDLQPHFADKRPETQRGYMTSLSLSGYHLPKCH